jgi:hypothetical protein
MRRSGLVVLVAFALGVAVLGVAAPAVAEPPHTHEILENRPSGFWTSNRPAVGGAYRYRLLLLGTAIALGTGLLTWRLIKRANAARAAGPTVPEARSVER